MRCVDRFKNELKNFLLTQKNGKMQGNQEWISLRCPFCGDSASGNTHLNVRVPMNDNILYMICFQPECDVHRFPRVQDIVQLGYTNLEVLEEFSKESLFIKIQKKNIEYNEGIKYPKDIPETVEKYIHDRLQIPKSMYAHNKIIGNVKEFLEVNDYIEPKVKENIRQRYGDDNDLVGFLNAGKTKLQIRRISKKEYIPYTLVSSGKFKFLDVHAEFESIHTEFDLKKQPVIVIVEGNFDRFNAMKLVNKPGLYIAALSADGIYRVFKKYSKLYRDVSWIIVSDRDVPKSEYEKLIVKPFGYRIQRLEVWYNGAEKDFGDMRDKWEPIKHTLI